MKKILFSIICFMAYILSARSQTLYGTTFRGGNDGGGTINRFIPATNDLIVAKSFESLPFFNPIYTNFIQASDGKLYGMAASAGSYNAGVIFSFDVSSSTYTKLVDFDSAIGSNPGGSLIQASDGKLYGMTYSGGSSNDGVIFSFDLSTSIYTKLKDFHFIDGIHPYGSLMQASDGKLYGMTTYGLPGGTVSMELSFPSILPLQLLQS